MPNLTPTEQQEWDALQADKSATTARLREINRQLRTLYNRGFARDRRAKGETA